MFSVIPTFSKQHFAHNTLPQTRQWCLRRTWVNFSLQSTQWTASESGIHLLRKHANHLASNGTNTCYIRLGLTAYAEIGISAYFGIRYRQDSVSSLMWCMSSQVVVDSITRNTFYSKLHLLASYKGERRGRKYVWRTFGSCGHHFHITNSYDFFPLVRRHLTGRASSSCARARITCGLQHWALYVKVDSVKRFYIYLWFVEIFLCSSVFRKVTIIGLMWWSVW